MIFMKNLLWFNKFLGVLSNSFKARSGSDFGNAAYAGDGGMNWINFLLQQIC